MEFSDRSSSYLAAARGNATVPHAHEVQFYENVDFLSGIVGDFARNGLTGGDSILLIAKREHGAAFMRRLREQGVDVAEALRSERVTLLDASDTLSRFMLGAVPDARAFDAVISAAVASARRASLSGGVRAFGEMVDVLWSENNRDGAVALEQLWNQLEHNGTFSLLCAYSLTNFSHVSDATHFHRICEQHTHVAPTESYTSRDTPGRLLEVALLQQRARSLESEIAERTALAEELRRTLDRERAARAEVECARVEAEEARRIAEDANRVKSEFLAMMSHELRTPLNAIGGYTELIELGIHGPVTREQLDALDRVQRSKRLLLGLIDQVLNYARIETGAVSYDLADVPVDEILNAAASLLAPQSRAKGLVSSYSGCDPRLTVRADREKLQQVVVNLLTNAVKFTERGGSVRVEVETAPALVTIRVVDSGIGIAPDRLEQIFHPFVQVDAQYTRRRDGVGLGLAISREFAVGMGGLLSVTSVPGTGSTFSLSLPRGSSST